MLKEQDFFNYIMDEIKVIVAGNQRTKKNLLEVREIDAQLVRMFYQLRKYKRLFLFFKSVCISGLIAAVGLFISTIFLSGTFLSDNFFNIFCFIIFVCVVSYFGAKKSKAKESNLKEKIAKLFNKKQDIDKENLLSEYYLKECLDKISVSEKEIRKLNSGYAKEAALSDKSESELHDFLLLNVNDSESGLVKDTPGYKAYLYSREHSDLIYEICNKPESVTDIDKKLRDISNLDVLPYDLYLMSKKVAD
jgi:hypothetical protein